MDVQFVIWFLNCFYHSICIQLYEYNVPWTQSRLISNITWNLVLYFDIYLNHRNFDKNDNNNEICIKQYTIWLDYNFMTKHIIFVLAFETPSVFDTFVSSLLPSDDHCCQQSTPAMLKIKFNLKASVNYYFRLRIWFF